MSEFTDKMNAQARKLKEKRFRKQIINDLRQLLRKVDGGFTTQCITEFIGCVGPNKLSDLATLPYYSPLGNKSLTHSKRDALAALISFTIQRFWAFCNDGEPEIKLRDAIKKLEAIIEAWPSCMVKGALKGGYWLEVK